MERIAKFTQVAKTYYYVTMYIGVLIGKFTCIREDASWGYS